MTLLGLNSLYSIHGLVSSYYDTIQAKNTQQYVAKEEPRGAPALLLAWENLLNGSKVLASQTACVQFSTAVAT